MKCINDHKERYRAKNLDTFKRIRLANKLKVIEFLSDHPCVDCGEKDWAVLQFDHVRGKKSFQISKKIDRIRWETLFAEILKCDVRCANCHQRRTIERNGWLEYIT